MRLKDADDLESRLRVSAAELDTTIYTAPSSQINGLYREFIRIIRQSPTIDPVKHGRWITSNCVISYGTGCKCSVCGGVFGRMSDLFCYHCGAKMDGETDETD